MNKRELKKLVNRGQISGHELGLLLMRDFWEADHDRPSVLDNDTLSYIRDKLRFKGVQLHAFDLWEYIYRLVDRTQLEAIISHHRARYFLREAISLAKAYHVFLVVGVLQAEQKEEVMSYLGHMFTSTFEDANNALNGPEAQAKSIRDTVRQQLDEARDNIKDTLAIRAVLSDLARLTGAPLTEDIDRHYELIKRDVELYDALLTPQRELSGILEQQEQLPPFSLDRLKPDRKAEKYYTDRIAQGLDEGWRELGLEEAEHV
jgi:hypothetical protein